MHKRRRSVQSKHSLRVKNTLNEIIFLYNLKKKTIFYFQLLSAYQTRFLFFFFFLFFGYRKHKIVLENKNLREREREKKREKEKEKRAVTKHTLRFLKDNKKTWLVNLTNLYIYLQQINCMNDRFYFFFYYFFFL